MKNRKNLLAAWPGVEPRVLAAPGLLVGLDFDGTLSPIVRRPEEAALGPKTREALERLAAIARVEVAVVSGRAVSDLAARVGLPRLTYVGNHGLEIARAGGLWLHPEAADAESLMAQAAGRLEGPVRQCPGAVLDIKGATLAVHYRNVDPGRVEALREAVARSLCPWLDRGDLRLRGGKMVMEIRPRTAWGKGHAMAFLLAGGAALPSEILMEEAGPYHGPTDGRLAFYIGDDVTDEDALAALAHLGVTAKVGPPEEATAASYWLASPDEVRAFLLALQESLRGRA